MGAWAVPGPTGAPGGALRGAPGIPWGFPGIPGAEPGVACAVVFGFTLFSAPSDGATAAMTTEAATMLCNILRFMYHLLIDRDPEMTWKSEWRQNSFLEASAQQQR